MKIQSFRAAKNSILTGKTGFGRRYIEFLRDAKYRIFEKTNFFRYKKNADLHAAKIFFVRRKILCGKIGFSNSSFNGKKLFLCGEKIGFHSVKKAKFMFGEKRRAQACARRKPNVILL